MICTCSLVQAFGLGLVWAAACPRWCRWCLCSSAAWPTCDAQRVGLAERTPAMTLMGPCGAGAAHLRSGLPLLVGVLRLV